MKKIFNCEIEYFKSDHLNQIYTGFEMLSKQGIINLKYKKGVGDYSKPVVKVIINKKTTVIYDTLDGLNWTSGNLEENLDYYSKIKADYYFKRSYTEELRDKNKNLKIYPLGFNYFIAHDIIFNDSIKNILKNTSLYKKIKPYKPVFNSSLFEKPFVKNKNNQIIFFTRLWNPEEETNPEKKADIVSLNNSRIKVIKTCKEKFGNIFIGGLEDSEYTRKTAPKYISHPDETRKLNYLKNVEKSNICITTRGLHNSTGWKFAEYISSSKAIISEPLQFSNPGNFSAGKNYLEFTNEEQLVNHINSLLNDNALIHDIMENNFKYYNEFLRPDKLILNSLLEIKKTLGN